jgi:plasmid maintenance system antidote protein VapI
MALARPRSIEIVKGSKRVSEAVREDFMRVFAKWVKDVHDDNQTAAGRELGMTQSHVSALLAGSRGPGIDLLIRMRKVTGLSLDQLLGLEKLPEVLTAQDVRKLSREEYAALKAEDEATRQPAGRKRIAK